MNIDIQTALDIVKKSVNRKRFRIPQPATFAIQYDPDEKPENGVDGVGARISKSLPGILVGIKYQDEYGDRSSRRITCKNIQKVGSDVYMFTAYCHEAEGPRNFRSDRMQEVVDLRTGEVFGTGLEFIRTLVADGMLPEEIHSVKPVGKHQRYITTHCGKAICVLVYMARCDGHFHEKELLVIGEFIKDICPQDEYDYDLLAILNHAAITYSDHSYFVESLEYLYKANYFLNKIIQPKLLKYLSDLIYADGILAQEEVDGVLEAKDVVADVKEVNHQEFLDDLSSGAWRDISCAVAGNLIFIDNFEFKKRCKDKGFHFFDFVHDGLKFLVHGKGGDQDVFEARTLGIEIITEIEFMNVTAKD
ncbi:MAG: hypothetical protein COB49_00620 [Alphaproteobacteria bacterium]|nr:MAG: hypothetical protein COB49_00620 [Alphaproteobacteria bacterium]